MFPHQIKTNLLDRFIAYNRRQTLFQTHESILLCVSGGLDSMVMLDLFKRIQSEYDLKLAVIHLNHGLRGSNADADEQWVQEFSAKSGFPFFTCLTDVGKFAEQNRFSVEEAGRTSRFAFFSRILNQTGFEKCSLAHHADDRAETVLMHIIRGSGLQGLAGISPKRDKIIHPMLFALKSDIRCWAEENHVIFHEDRSNRERIYFRNRIRLDIIENLKRTTPHIAQVICRTADAAAEAEEWIQEGVRRAVSEKVLFRQNDETILDIHQFLKYFTAVQKAIIIHALRLSRPGSHYVNHPEIEGLYKLIHHAKSGTIYPLSDSIFAVVSGNQFVLTKRRARVRLTEIPRDRWVNLPEWNGKIRIKSRNPSKNRSWIHHSPDIEFIDDSQLEPPFIVRTWNPGDRFQPLGMKGFKKIQDFFVDMKVPNYMRHRIPILWDQNGIVWVIGYRLSNRFRMKPETKTVVQLEWKSIQNRKPA